MCPHCSDLCLDRAIVCFLARLWCVPQVWIRQMKYRCACRLWRNYLGFRMMLSQNRQALVLLMAKGWGLVLIVPASLDLGKVPHTLSTMNDDQAVGCS